MQIELVEPRVITTYTKPIWLSVADAESLRPQLPQRYKQSTHCVRNVFVWSD
jgi:hypothetical protein